MTIELNNGISPDYSQQPGDMYDSDKATKQSRKPHKKPERNPEFAHKIKVDIEKWRNHWKPNEDTYNEYLQFVFGNQWLDEEARVFENYKKIPMTFNKCAPLMNHLVGEQRQNTPGLQVVPDDSVDVQTAEVREALVKDITFDSTSKVVLQTAFQCAAAGGYGAFRICTEYENEHTFDQVIRFKKIDIPTRCFWDVAAETPAKTDGMYAGWIIRLSREKFKAIYGQKIEASIGYDNLDDGTVFNDADAITMTYYYSREYSTTKLYKLTNGRTVEQDDFQQLQRVMIDGKKLLLDQNMPVAVIDTREAPRYKVIFRLYAGEWELEKEDFPSQQLPILFVDQNSFFDKEGKQVIRPFLKDAKDAQKYINYIGTSSAYLLKIARYDQFVAAKGNVRGNDVAQIWRDPSNTQGALVFDEVPSGFTPQRQEPPELPQSHIQQYERALLDIQSSTGMYNAQLGNQGNEISGAAVDARTKRGSYITYVPFDALNRAWAVAGEIVNEMIPQVYDTHRVMNLTLKDKGQAQIPINEPMDEYGSGVKHDMTKGRYSIKLIPGPSWEGQKQENLDAIKDVLQASPELFPLVADLYVENLPLANSIELRNRLRTIVPPEIIQAGKTGEQPPPKQQEPNPQDMAAQAMAQAAQMQAQAKMVEAQVKQQHLQIEQMKLQLSAQELDAEVQQKWQQLENERLATAAELQEMELRYIAETQRTQTDAQISQANNLVSLLTHHSTQQAKAQQAKA